MISRLSMKYPMLSPQDEAVMVILISCTMLKSPRAASAPAANKTKVMGCIVKGIFRSTMVGTGSLTAQYQGLLINDAV